MIESLVPIIAFGFALGIADAERVGASAKVQAANPINKSRFMKCLLLGSRYLAIPANAWLDLFITWAAVGRATIATG